jgi:hypothetical protein
MSEYATTEPAVEPGAPRVESEAPAAEPWTGPSREDWRHLQERLDTFTSLVDNAEQQSWAQQAEQEAEAMRAAWAEYLGDPELDPEGYADRAAEYAAAMAEAHIAPAVEAMQAWEDRQALEYGQGQVDDLFAREAKQVGLEEYDAELIQAELDLKLAELIDSGVPVEEFTPDVIREAVRLKFEVLAAEQGKATHYARGGTVASRLFDGPEAQRQPTSSHDYRKGGTVMGRLFPQESDPLLGRPAS